MAKGKGGTHVESRTVLATSYHIRVIVIPFPANTIILEHYIRCLLCFSLTMATTWNENTVTLAILQNLTSNFDRIKVDLRDLP